jgi:hypothetical protein
MVITKIDPITGIYELRNRSKSKRLTSVMCFKSNRQKHRGKEHDLVLPSKYGTVSTVTYGTVPVQEIGTVLNTINQKVRKEGFGGSNLEK